MKGEKLFRGRSEQASTHFAAVNSGRGFVSFYREVFGREEIKRRYIIKGGPGTGKSSFMRKVAMAAEEKGRTVEYYRCSSDPSSLDGMIIDGEIALLDGTAPHVYEPHLAGASDELVDLGAFWDSNKLYSSYNEIAALSALKSNAYGRCYKFLSAAMNVEEVNRDLVSGALLRGKMYGAASRLLRDIPDGDGFSISYGFVNAIGMKGHAHLDTFERQAERLYFVYDSYGFGHDLLLAVIEAAREKKLPIRVSYSPLMPELPDAVYLSDSRVAFVLTDGKEGEGALRINVKRFVDGERIARVRTEYRMNKRLADALMTSAVEALSDAGDYHFQLEKIYTSCMDFQAENRFAEEFCEKILNSELSR